MKHESEPAYVTTYCNRPHRIRDGKPVGHECAIIPPASLNAEMNGDFKLANELMERGKTASSYGERSLPTMRRGVKS